jgi:capsule polysaccharide export protein KpsE/RkpR
MDTIEGVSIISVGEAKGHGLFVDMQTLQEVKSCAETYKGGVKVNLDHGAGIKDIVGFVDNFRIIGDQLLGDLNLLENAEKRDYILEIANKLPDTFGISIAFSGPIRERDGRRFASCNELYSADLVQTPAANPTGLFSFEAKGVDNNFNQMEDATIEIEPKEKEDEISIADIVSRLTALEAAFGDYKKKMEEMPAAEPEKEMSEDSALSKLEAKLDTIITNFGAAPLKASVVAEEKAPESFDLKAVVEAKTKELGSRMAAIKFAMTNHPTEYIALRDANQLNF